MFDEDRAMREVIAAELADAAEETAQLRRELDAIESDLARVIELFMRCTGRADLALDFLDCLGNSRGTRTLH
jgi:hypothetical protein